jgi:hypothetical protein
LAKLGSEEDVITIYLKMKSQDDSILERWEIPPASNFVAGEAVNDSSTTGNEKKTNQ